MPFAKVIAKKIKNLNKDIQAKFLSPENAMVKEIIDRIEVNFVSSDINKNGVLKELEFFDFSKKMLLSWKNSFWDEIEFNKDFA